MLVRTQHQTDLKDFTSLYVGGPAATLITTEPGDSLVEIIAAQSDPTHILGFGTNVLVSDKGLPGAVILNQAGKIDKTGEFSYRVDSGVVWDDFIQRLIADKAWGLEFTSGIPGGVGAAVAGNIAAYGHQVADRLVSATVLNNQSGEISIWDKDRFEFSYRSSSIQKPENQDNIILDATFELSPQIIAGLEYDSALHVAEELELQADTLENRRHIIMETRRRAGSLLTSQTSNHHTAGSFFKNPLVGEEQVEKILSFEEQGISRDQLLRQNKIHGGNQARVSAAHVLLAAGFKRGQTWGQVRLHPEHILKIENMGQATATDIYKVVQEIISTVQDKLSIVLEPEVRFFGEF